MNENHYEVRPWLYVGNANYCEKSKNNFDIVVHIWRSDYPNLTCTKGTASTKTGFDLERYKTDGSDIFVEYKDGESISEKMLEMIIASITELGASSIDMPKILVHCSAGQTRSSTIAMFILSIFEKLHPFDSTMHIHYAAWNQRGIIANICHQPLGDIVKFWTKLTNQE